MRSAPPPQSLASRARSRSTPAASVAMWKAMLALRRMAAGSRPSASHQRSNTPFRRLNSVALVYAAFQPSARRAAISKVRFSPRPPIQIGSRACSGFGQQAASSTW